MGGTSGARVARGSARDFRGAAGATGHGSESATRGASTNLNRLDRHRSGSRIGTAAPARFMYPLNRSEASRCSPFSGNVHPSWRLARSLVRRDARISTAASLPIIYTFCAVFALGCNLISASNITSPPSAPSSVSVRVAGKDALRLRIGYPGDDGNSNVTHYNVTVRGGFDGPLQVFQSVPTVGAAGWKAFSGE